MAREYRSSYEGSYGHVIPSYNSTPTRLASSLPSSSNFERSRKWNQFRMLNRTLDRVNVLGDDSSEHTGCVNALSWAEDGNLLISGGDDKTVRLWRMSSTDHTQEYPFVCTSVISTGHRANIFNAKLLPYSTRIASAAGDHQIRVFDATTAVETAPDAATTKFSYRQVGVQVIRCHDDAAKRIATENSPDIFLSVSEDGTVRQHDLRTPHNCSNKTCSSVLMKTDNYALSALSLSPITPHQFVVAGESEYGFLYDRRHLKSTIEGQWGKVPRAGQGMTTCVRRFGRPTEAKSHREHITGAKISRSNGHEVLLTYSGDAVYLYSTYDDAANKDDFSAKSASGTLSQDENAVESPEDDFGGPFRRRRRIHKKYEPGVPIAMPRNRFVGAQNVATVKDVNFVGPDDQWVVSGSDDGNFFIWDKKSEKLCGVYEGDSTIVNVIEGHPHFPLLAISGIDTSIKLFAPSFYENSDFSRMENADEIIEQNQRADSSPLLISPGTLQLLASLRASMDEGDTRPLECTQQ
ncbi:hypothetical protein D9619_000906 [Psilocybe cf. subviscida]|uniref:WD40 repeat-like protein n=1 Tax=Psilocybe cf. subviscida TaxID=2480587 RepID=A0A8H5F2E8_9AGAR|nr:hypothetical protein D9619_000906 [Psilocybe cf. subviscida]